MSLLNTGGKRSFDSSSGDDASSKKQAMPPNYPALAAAKIASLHPNTPFAIFWWPTNSTVYYAFDDHELSCVTVLLQRLSAQPAPDNISFAGQKIRHIASYDPSSSLLDVGMAKFAGLDTTSCFVPVHATASVTRANEEISANRLRLIQVNSLRARTELDLFTLNGLGPAPNNVDLTRETSAQKQDGHHTVHRLYMMAAYALAKSASRQTGPHTFAGGKYIGAILATTGRCVN